MNARCSAGGVSSPWLAAAAAVVFSLASISAAEADSGAIAQYSSRSWQLDEGLPHNQVEAITQTPDGYLWVGTHAGLVKFDGITFTPFDEKLAPGMANHYIDALWADTDGTLWIGTYHGLYCWKDRTCLRYGTSDGLAGNLVNGIIQSRDGSHWIATAAGVSHWNGGKFVNFTKKNGLVSDDARSVFEDRNGTIWVGTANGVSCITGGVIQSFPMNIGPVHAIAQDSNGRLWIGANHGLLWYDHGRFHSDAPEDQLPDGLVVGMLEDSKGSLWVGTHSGLSRFKDGVYYNELNEEGIPYDKVNVIFEDRQGNIWAGSREGLIRRTPKHLLTYTRLQGLSHNNVMSVLADRAGNLWVGTWGGGLDRLSGTNVTVYTTSNGISNNLVLSLCEAHDGSLWVGADYDAGLMHFQNGKSTTYTWRDGLFNSPVRVVYEDHSGRVWAGTQTGLCCRRNGKFVRYTRASGLVNNLVRAICEDHDGNLWIGTDGGLSRWRNGKFTNFTTTNGLSTDSLIALYEDAETNLWIGTLGGGVNRLKDGRFTHYTTQQGLFSDDALEIVEDDYGYLWMSCTRGIYRVLKKDLENLDAATNGLVACVSFGRSDGMETSQCNGAAKPGGCKLSDGRVCFPTTKGLVVALPMPPPKVPEPTPPVYITDVTADNRAIDFGGSGATAAGSADFTVPPGRGELEFQYTALSLSSPEKNRFKYKLEGADTDWIDAGTRRLAHYNHLYPKHYRFRVLGCNGHGVWNETGASVSFVLQPHFWQTWWFFGVVAASALGTVGGAVRFWMVQKWRRRLLLLEMQNSLERERARIARDIHDDLGATLTQITLLSELTRRESGNPGQVTQHADQIARAARGLVQAMDETVWAVNPKNDNLPRLAGYIFQYAEKFFSGSAVRCHFDSPDDVPDRPMTAEARHHLFLAAKEAMNNVARHSSASQVWLRLKVSDAELVLSVEDNGHGLPVENDRQFGNGLTNMRRRMEEIGGTFAVESSVGGGTSVYFKLNLR